jgi:hypothetical protein
MTEAEWLQSADVVAMLKSLEGKATDRKLRLFGCAGCRRVWDLLSEEGFRDAVEVAERFADGQAGRKELSAARSISGAALERNGLAGVSGPADCALGSAWSATRMSAWTAALDPLWVFTGDTERAAQAALLHEVFGNPYRPIAISSDWLTPNVVSQADAIYVGSAFERMPSLGDALEESGCRDLHILRHCREPREHVRGCWLIDAILGKS